MNIDKLKNIVLLIFVGATLFFGLKWYWGGNDVTKEQLKNLQKEYNILEGQKKDVDKEISTLKDKFKLKEEEDIKQALEVEKAKQAVKDAIAKADKSKQELDKLKTNLDNIKKNIEDFKKNPPKLSDDELLESLRKKLN